ncbi:MAG: radical SAM protein, partial [Clostridiales Family XIII bacterium]|nr:radical SAM protein [Clostridiales Family XIII bacterium]
MSGPKSMNGPKSKCGICPRGCDIPEGATGFCRARANVSGRVVCKNYGLLTALALDPIEKKPLARFMPGSMILSAGSFGCNLRCPFCQNHSISMSDGEGARLARYTPEALALVPRGNIGLAYTYNEPLVGYEFVMSAAAAVRGAGLKNVVVTNGFIQKEPLIGLLPLIDAMNIDLKGFTEGFYSWVGGGLADVMRSIELAAARCHVEVTTLIIPGRNDSEDEMARLAGWLAGIDRGIAL